MKKALIVAVMVLLLVVLGAGAASANHTGVRHLSPMRVVNEMPSSVPSLAPAAAYRLSPVRLVNEPAGSRFALTQTGVGYRLSPIRTVNDDLDAAGRVVRK